MHASQAPDPNTNLVVSPIHTNSSATHVVGGPSQNTRRSEVELTDQTNLLPTKKIIICFLGLSLCNLVCQLDSVITATALPTISATFNAGSIASWVPVAYMLTSTSFTTLYGRFSDIFGRKRVLTAALSIMMVGNLAAGFSKSILQLIISRGIAGAGGGAVRSLSAIIISDVVSLRDRGKYQAIMASVQIIGIGVGPVVGGALAQKAGWRWCFWFNVPAVLCAVTAMNLVLPLKPVRGNMKEKLLVVDYLGSGLTLVSCTLILLPLIWGGVTFPWNSPTILGLLGGALIACIIFILWEWKGATLPVVPMYIFKNPTVCGVYLVGIASGMIRVSIMYYLPQFFQIALGFDPIHAGVFLIPVLASQMTLNQISGQIMSRTGRYRFIIISGYTVLAIANGLNSTITPVTHHSVLVIFMLLSGVGSGQTFQTTTVAAQASVPRKDMAVVTAFRNFVRSLGGTMGLAIGSAIINNTLRTSMQRLSISADTIKRAVDNPRLLAHPASIGLSPKLAMEILYGGYIAGLRHVFILNASLAAAAAILSMFLIKETSLTREDEEMLKAEGRRLHGTAEDEEKGQGGTERDEKIPKIANEGKQNFDEKCNEKMAHTSDMADFPTMHSKDPADPAGGPSVVSKSKATS